MNRNSTLYVLFMIPILMYALCGAVHAEDEACMPRTCEGESLEDVPYGDVTWGDVNAEKEGNSNPITRFWSYLFREKKVDSVSNEDITVVETVTFSDDKDAVIAPVGVVAVHESAGAGRDQSRRDAAVRRTQ